MSEKMIIRYTLGEEIANTLSHGLSAIAFAAGGGAMVTLAVSYDSGRAVLSSVIFRLSLVLMYSMSALYHGAPVGKTKEFLRVFDHASIPLLIAGSYTPFCLVLLEGRPKGAMVSAVVWVCAIIAITLNLINLEKFEKLNLVIYVVMGWSALIALKDILAALPSPGFLLLLGGGLSYTFGIVFYKMKNKRYMHSVWHIFVTIGSLMHFMCVTMYVLPTS